MPFKPDPTPSLCPIQHFRAQHLVSVTLFQGEMSGNKEMVAAIAATACAITTIVMAQQHSTKRVRSRQPVYRVLKKKYRLSLSVIFVDNLFSENRFRFLRIMYVQVLCGIV